MAGFCVDAKSMDDDLEGYSEGDGALAGDVFQNYMPTKKYIGRLNQKRAHFDDMTPKVYHIEYPEDGLHLCLDKAEEPYWWSEEDRRVAAEEKRSENYWHDLVRWSIDQSKWEVLTEIGNAPNIKK